MGVKIKSKKPLMFSLELDNIYILSSKSIQAVNVCSIIAQGKETSKGYFASIPEGTWTAILMAAGKMLSHSISAPYTNVITEQDRTDSDMTKLLYRGLTSGGT